MARPIVAVSSVIVGCLAFVVAARLTLHHEAPDPVTPAAHAPAAALPVRPPVPAIIRLKPQLIRASLPHRRQRAAQRARRTAAPARGWPCSPWRALGPVYSVHEGEKPRQRHVRSLCFGPRPSAATR